MDSRIWNNIPMKKMYLKAKILSFLPGLVLLSSCATSNITTEVKMEFRNWRAESENVVNLSILLEDDGTESCPVLLNENTFLFESKKNDNYDLWFIIQFNRSNYPNYDNTFLKKSL